MQIDHSLALSERWWKPGDSTCSQMQSSSINRSIWMPHTDVMSKRTDLCARGENEDTFVMQIKYVMLRVYIFKCIQKYIFILINSGYSLLSAVTFSHNVFPEGVVLN